MALLSIRPLALPLLCLGACDALDTAPQLYNGAESGITAGSGFQQAAADHDVPIELLAAIAATETGVQPVSPHEEFEGRAERWGIMGIPDAWLEDAAWLAGVDVDAARTERDPNITAAAALLSDWAGDIDRADLGAWGPVVARYGGLELDEATALYVHDEVYGWIGSGVQVEGLITDPSSAVPYTDPPLRHAPAGERPGTVSRPSPNHSARPSGAAGGPSLIVIHSCEGSYSGCWSWLANPRSGVSAHYVVNTDGTEVTQLVSEHRKAWHVGSRYDCDLVGGEQCARDGQSINDFSIGVEHAGYASQSSWNVGLLSVSSELVCEIARDHGIPRDAYHIVSHGSVQPYNRVDPGPNWPWASYLADVRAHCGDDRAQTAAAPPVEEEVEDESAPPPPPPAASTAPGTETLVIDSNNGSNMPGRAVIEVSSNWRSSTNVGGYYNTGYFWRTTGPTADGAWFHARIDAPGCYEVQAWWSAGTDRSPTAPWFVFGADGAELGYVEVDQRTNGGRWNSLGTYALETGWSSVALSRWAPSGDVVIADAVRIRPATGCSG